LHEKLNGFAEHVEIKTGLNRELKLARSGKSNFPLPVGKIKRKNVWDFQSIVAYSRET
jgi:hypothetical protein